MKILFVLLLLPFLGSSQSMVVKQERTKCDEFTAYLGKVVFHVGSINDKITTISIYEGAVTKEFTGSRLDSLLLVINTNKKKGGDFETLLHKAYQAEADLVTINWQRERSPANKN